jgi:hypothetical protein
MSPADSAVAAGHPEEALGVTAGDTDIIAACQRQGRWQEGQPQQEERQAAAAGQLSVLWRSLRCAGLAIHTPHLSTGRPGKRPEVKRPALL